MPESDWRPTASLEVLTRRAELLARIRAFFAGAGVLEVDTPLLGTTGVTDVHIETIEARLFASAVYLQSSPEFFMKRLLAAGCGPIYSLGKVFRDGETGRRHRPEFTLLEWYRPGWDERALMAEVGELMAALFGQSLPVRTYSYGEIFEQVVGVNPHSAGLEALVAAAGDEWRGETRSTVLDLLFSRDVEPALPDGLVFVSGYPACQAALARLGVDERGETVARRFEVFVNRMELGNGYFELTDPGEQRRRFEADLAERARLGRRGVPVDEKLLAALEAGLPDCAGVAIGVDRLLMQLLAVDDIAEVVPFG